MRHLLIALVFLLGFASSAFAVESSNNATVTTVGPVLTDASGNTYGIATDGKMTLNGAELSATGNVIELAYVNHTVYAENSSNNWYGFNSSGTATSGPTTTSPITTGVESANNTTVTTVGPQLTDASGNTFGIAADAKMTLNGAELAVTGNIIELAYVNHTVWAENSSNNWYSFNSSGTTTSGPTTTSPLTVVAESANDTTVTTVGPVLTDANGVSWGINASTQMVRAGVALGQTNAVTELAYVNHVVWAENSSGSWYSFNADGTTAAGPASSPLPNATVTGNSPTGIKTPADMVAYFNSITGKHTISGEYIDVYGIGPIQTIQQQTGYWLGMIEGVWWGCCPQFNNGYTAIAQAWWAAGGIPVANVPMPNPTTGGTQGDVSSLDAAGLTVSGTASNTALNKNLTLMGNELLTLQNAGVVIIIRCYHEMNGAWNWWGTGGGAGGGTGITAAQYIALYRYTWNFWHGMGINNVVYEYAVNAGYPPDLTSTYPGSQYVDIVGADIYSNNPGPDVQSSYTTLSQYGKPFALAEFGPGSASAGNTSFSETTLISQIQQYVPNAVYFLNWWDGNGQNAGWGMAETQNVASALSNPWVINRGGISYASATPSSGGQPIVVILGANDLRRIWMPIPEDRPYPRMASHRHSG